MSFADYLGLNEASLRELEDGAMARAAAADEQASSALGKAYQQADADVNAGGAGQLSQQMGYMDFVKAQREAESARALPTGATSPYEDVARASMRVGQPQQPSVAGRAQVMRQDLASRRGAVSAGRAAQKAYVDRQQADRDAQQKQFEAARTNWAGGVQRELDSLQPKIDRATGWSQYQSSSPDAPDQQAAAQRRERAQSELRYYGGRRAQLQQQQATFGQKAR